MVTKQQQSQTINPPTREDYELYEKLKAAWDTSHPNASYHEREKALAQIYKELGI